MESLNRGQIEEAIALFKTALEYEPDSVQILNNIGLAYAKHQDFDGAFEWCRPLEGARRAHSQRGVRQCICLKVDIIGYPKVSKTASNTINIIVTYQ